MAATKSKYGKISKSYILILTQLNHLGYGMPVKCTEQPLEELTVQVWLLLLYHHPKF